MSRHPGVYQLYSITWHHSKYQGRRKSDEIALMLGLNQNMMGGDGQGLENGVCTGYSPSHEIIATQGGLIGIKQQKYHVQAQLAGHTRKTLQDMTGRTPGKKTLENMTHFNIHFPCHDLPQTWSHVCLPQLLFGQVFTKGFFQPSLFDDDKITENLKFDYVAITGPVAKLPFGGIFNFLL